MEYMEDPLAIADAEAGAGGAEAAPNAGLVVEVVADEEPGSQRAKKTRTVNNLTPAQQKEVNVTFSTRLKIDCV